MPPIVPGDLSRFLERRQERWLRLQSLLERAERDGLGALSPAEIREFGTLYRRASSDLVVARARTANAEILDYLNDLVARAYAQVYRSRRFEPRDLFLFLRRDFPRLFRRFWRPIALCAAVMLLAAVAGWTVGHRDRASAYALLPPALVDQIPALREHWRESTGHTLPPEAMAALSAWLIAHNTALGIAAFVSGVALGLPTLYLMVQTGFMLGVLGQGLTRPETALVFWSLILPHGVVELPAVCVMGGAGLVLAGAVLAPGKRTRREALLERGRPAVMLAAGGAAMFAAAGLIEGFITPPAFLHPWAKLLFAGLAALGQIAYFGFCSPEPATRRGADRSHGRAAGEDRCPPSARHRSPPRPAAPPRSPTR